MGLVRTSVFRRKEQGSYQQILSLAHMVHAACPISLFGSNQHYQGALSVRGSYCTSLVSGFRKPLDQICSSELAVRLVSEFVEEDVIHDLRGSCLSDFSGAFGT